MSQQLIECQNRSMSPKQPRHLVTQTEARSSIDKAGRRREDRLAAIRRTSGVLTGNYDADFLEQLRADWPA
jgi:hypothetical protein